jgi:hypothetical protein
MFPETFPETFLETFPETFPEAHTENVLVGRKHPLEKYTNDDKMQRSTFHQCSLKGSTFPKTFPDTFNVP